MWPQSAGDKKSSKLFKLNMKGPKVTSRCRICAMTSTEEKGGGKFFRIYRKTLQRVLITQGLGWAADAAVVEKKECFENILLNTIPNTYYPWMPRILKCYNHCSTFDSRTLLYAKESRSTQWHDTQVLQLQKKPQSSSHHLHGASADVGSRSP